MSALPQPQPEPPASEQPQLQIVEPRPPTRHPVRVGPIVRDVVIVWVLTAMGGLVAGLATGGAQADPQRSVLALMVANFLLGSVAFTIAGCLAPPPKWRHLAFVALGAWLTSLVNVVFFHVTIPQWIGSAIFIAFIMGIGGTLSYIFKKG